MLEQSSMTQKVYKNTIDLLCAGHLLPNMRTPWVRFSPSENQSEKVIFFFCKWVSIADSVLIWGGSLGPLLPLSPVTLSGLNCVLCMSVILWVFLFLCLFFACLCFWFSKHREKAWSWQGQGNTERSGGFGGREAWSDYIVWKILFFSNTKKSFK